MNWLQAQGLFRHLLTLAGGVGVTAGLLVPQLSAGGSAITMIAGGVSALCGIIASLKAPEKKAAA